VSFALLLGLIIHRVEHILYRLNSFIMIDMNLVGRTCKEFLFDEEMVAKLMFRRVSDSSADSEKDCSGIYSTIRAAWLPSYQDIDDSVSSFSDYLCGSHCRGDSTKGPTAVDTPSARNHKAKRRKRVTYSERVEIREYTIASVYHSSNNSSRKYNSQFTMGYGYFAPSFYRHINQSKHRTADYRPPPVITMAERRRRRMVATYDSKFLGHF
jgi:hypothetical protein